jgi:Glucose-6-phosphate 1-dehydrogenase (EC 1.1.1.49)
LHTLTQTKKEGISMKINSHLFEVFNREEFIYRKNAEGAEQIRKEYSTAWNNWKVIVKTALIKSGNQELVMENTEKWQNSGNLSSRFWTRIKDANLFKKPSCIAAMISKDNVRVYLEWHGYKNEHLTEERKIHNTWLQNVENWVREKHVDPKEYRVWTSKEAVGGFEQYHTLEEYLNNRTIAEQFQNII